MSEADDIKTLLIGGVWMAASSTLDVVNPYDGQKVGMVARASREQVLDAVRRAKAYRSSLSAFDRAEILRRTAALIAANRDEFCRSIVLESGLALKDAAKEVTRALNTLDVCAEESKRLNGESIGTDTTAERKSGLAITRREPIGLVCAITPFNRPLNQVVVKLGPAIAANNSVVLKPSEKTPLTAIRFVKALIQSGLPAAMVSLVTGSPEEVGPALVENEFVDMLTFTGSAAVGERLARSAPMIRTLFELGDSGALIVLADADLKAAALTAAAGAFAGAGQSCRGVKRIIADDQIAGPLADMLVEEAKKLRVGDPSDGTVDVGCLISEAAAKEVDRRVGDAVARGATILCGARRSGAQYWPTVLDRVPASCELVQEETFGPCAPIIRVSGLDEAISCANATPFGLQTGLFTNDLRAALTAARILRTGAVIVNGGPQFESPNIPFGGVKKSGLGREGVRFAIQEMTTVKTIVFADADL